MNTRRRRFSPADSFLAENLEGRVVLSAAGIQSAVAAAVGRSAHQAPTVTGLTVNSGTLGQPTTFNVTVRAPAASGSPRGTVNIVDHGKIIQTLTLTPTPSTGGKFAYSSASYTMTPQPGGNAIFYGKYSVSAKYKPSGPFARSNVTKSFTVAQPPYRTIANGVKVATTVNGSGPTLQVGQKAGVLYTGYLAKTGAIFDNSATHGNSLLAFDVGARQVIPGFDAGVVGMQVGETRIIEIPASQGYGNVSNGSIPANSTLVFIVTLKAMS